MFFFFVSSCLSKNNVYKTCADADCDKEIRETETFKKGDRIAVTAIFTGYVSQGNETDPVYTEKYMRFYPTVDDLAILQMQDENCTLTNMTNSTLQLQVGEFKTARWAYRPVNKSEYVTDFFSAQIEMKEGKVTGIYFDTVFDSNSCKGERFQYRCAKKRLVTDKCENNELVKTFLGFAGSDSNEEAFVSRQYMPSSFIKFGLRGVIDDATSLFNQAKDYVVDLFK